VAKAGLIEVCVDLLTLASVGGEHRISFADQIHSGSGDPGERITSSGNGEETATLERQDARKLPVAGQGARYQAVAQSWHVPNVGRDETMPAVGCGGAVPEEEVEWIRKRRVLRGLVA